MNDKQKHFLVGFFFGLLTYPIALFTGFMWSMAITFIAGSIIFIGKEFFDMYKPHPTGFDKIDLASDYFGWIGGSILSFFAFGITQIIIL